MSRTGTALDTIAALEAENERLREALLPFARHALTRSAKDKPDAALVEVNLGVCRAAQRALAAE
jgi:hypothetical protein